MNIYQTNTNVSRDLIKIFLPPYNYEAIIIINHVHKTLSIQIL